MLQGEIRVRVSMQASICSQLLALVFTGLVVFSNKFTGFLLYSFDMLVDLLSDRKTKGDCAI